MEENKSINISPFEFQKIEQTYDINKSTSYQSPISEEDVFKIELED